MTIRPIDKTIWEYRCDPEKKIDLLPEFPVYLKTSANPDRPIYNMNDLRS